MAKILLSIKDDRVERLDAIATDLQVSRQTIIKWAIDKLLGLPISVPDCNVGNTTVITEAQPANA